LAAQSEGNERRSEAQMSRGSGKTRHSGGAMATEQFGSMSQSTEAQSPTNRLDPYLATQNQSQDRTEMLKYARAVNQRPLGEILLEKEKDKR
jgi:hypothetical protein